MRSAHLPVGRCATRSTCHARCVAAGSGLASFMTSFVPRAEQERVIDLMDTGRLVTIVGPGGAGKTRLAVECLTVVEARFDQCVCVDVQGVAGGALAGVVAEQLGSQVRSGEPVATVASALGDRRSLLVLDSCEPVVEECAQLVHELLAMVSGLSVLCTSRQPLALDGEALVRIGPLQDGAASLLIDRARLVDPAFGSTDAASIDRICESVGALPLAIELAAAQLDHLSVGELAEALDRGSHRLVRESTTIVRRHRSMEACVAWSLDLLTEPDRAALRQLSVFRSGFDLASAAVMLATDEIGASQIVARLVARSLIVAERGSPTRFRLFDVVRDVAADERRSTDDAEVTSRYIDWAVRRCEHAGTALETRHLDDVVRQLLVDDADLVAAFTAAAGRADLAAIEQMYGALALHWITAGRFAQADAWLATCRAVADGRPLGARTLWTAALVAVYSGRNAEAIELAGSALQAARDDGDQSIAARALDVLGFATMTTDSRTAERMLTDAVDLATRVDDQWCRADAGQIAGYAALTDGRPEDARRHLLAARPITESLAHPQLLAWDRAGTAAVDALSGRFAGAADGLRHAAIHASATGDPNITATVLAFRARVAIQLGDPEAWVQAVVEQLDECTRRGAGQGAAALAAVLLELTVATGDLAAAEHTWAQIDATFGETASPDRAMGHASAAAALLAGRPDDARQRLGRTRTPEHHHEPLRHDAVWGAAVALHAAELAAARRILRLGSDDRTLPQGAIARHDLALAWSALLRAEGDLERSEAVLRLAGGPLAGDARAPSLLARVLAPWLGDTNAAVGVTPARVDDAIDQARRRSSQRTPQFGWTALTSSEHRVIALAAEGHTNRVIAARLGVAPGTVKSHLEHIYAKTGITNRTELATEYHRTTDSHHDEPMDTSGRSG